jgi:hypothetical protein
MTGKRSESKRRRDVPATAHQHCKRKIQFRDQDCSQSVSQSVCRTKSEVRNSKKGDWESAMWRLPLPTGVLCQSAPSGRRFFCGVQQVNRGLQIQAGVQASRRAPHPSRCRCACFSPTASLYYRTDSRWFGTRTSHSSSSVKVAHCPRIKETQRVVETRSLNSPTNSFDYLVYTQPPWHRSHGYRAARKPGEYGRPS